MRIEQRTKYKCDGCEKEVENPSGWSTLMPLMVGSFTLTVGASMQHGHDYCATCVKHMREAVAMPRVTA